MTRDQVIPALRDALPGLRAEFGVDTLDLFGSVARGDDRPGSDVDVLVQFLPGSRPTLFTLAGLKLRLEDLLGREVDVGTPGGLRPDVRASVDAERLRVA
jgi:uncharacterized protein